MSEKLKEETSGLNGKTETEKKPKETKDVREKPRDIIIRLEEEKAYLKDQLLRNVAELENFKKRMTQEKIKERKYASMDLIGDLVLSLDHLNMVVKMDVEDEKLKTFLVGFKMINDQIFQVLENDGLERLETKDAMFDPNIHYAVEKINTKDLPDGIVIEEVQPGYMYKEKLLRPAMVKVNDWSDENGKDK